MLGEVEDRSDPALEQPGNWIVSGGIVSGRITSG
jgi:hypothetical protein